MKYDKTFDVIVVGGGHSGTEAALAAARMGCTTLLLTHNISTVGEMSCNPAIGGIGKGHLVKEIDAMGGIMGRAADKSGIHFRLLNRSKGPAVRATRAQTDRALYKQAIRSIVEQTPGLCYFQQSVESFIIEKDRIQGVVTKDGIEFYAKTVILTAGTFLGGKIHIGHKNFSAGRAGDPPSLGLSEQLRSLSLRVGRLKTGTPPRLDGRTLDYSVMQEQPGEHPIPGFSFWEKAVYPQQVSCFITHTNQKTHDIIRGGLDRSPLYQGVIEGTGPRYCPSIEDKIVRFSERDHHQIFIEPEGLNTFEIYPNGISTSLPFDLQLEFIRSIRGLENAHLTRAGYAIEYDYFDPRDLMPTLETKAIQCLFFAGQINGTTGYEEAAAQGLLAGVNAACQALDKEPWMAKRSESYLGVMIDDLVTLGASEPYRMFTSRSEYRLTLREDNADQRLSPIAHNLGLISDEAWSRFEAKQEAVIKETQRLKNWMFKPNTPEANRLAEQLGKPLSHEVTALELLKRPEVSYATLAAIPELACEEHNDQVSEQVEIRVKYAGYIDRQEKEIASTQRQENTLIPFNFEYDQVAGLSHELREKLMRIQPKTIGQAMRISGMTPAATSVLCIYLRKYAQA